MVSFEEMIRALDLRNVLLKFLMNVAHPFLRKNFKIDMDEVQAWVLENTPEATVMNQFITVIVSAIFWKIVFLVLHYAIIPTFMNAFKSSDKIKPWFEKSAKEKEWYTSYWHAIVHAFVATAGAVYCFIYADGSKGTTWFHCNYYKLNMFPI